MPPRRLNHSTSTRLGIFPLSHMRKIRMTPSVNGKLVKLCAYFAASDHDENVFGPINGNSAYLPNVMLSPVSPRMTKQVAVIQCTKRSKALKRTIFTPERPDSI